MAVLRSGKVTSYEFPKTWNANRRTPVSSSFRKRLVIKKHTAAKKLPNHRQAKQVTTEKKTAVLAVKKGATKAKKSTVASVPATQYNKKAIGKKLCSKFHIEQCVVDMILATIIEGLPKVNFEEIIGQEEAVKSVRERIVYPALNPDLFKGQKVLKPPRGVLMYGPTGNGKTLLAKACASHTHYNFMNVQASTLVSKWVGDSEKLVKLLFETAKEIQPTIIFIDEIDAMLSQRCGSEREDSRRFKNEFLVHFDGMLSSGEDRVLILGATNLPQSIDTAALRRFDLRVYMGPPSQKAREKVIRLILKDIPRHSITEPQIKQIAACTEGFSAADLGTIARNAAWLPLGTLNQKAIPTLTKSAIPAVKIEHFMKVVDSFIPSNTGEEMAQITQWNNQHRTRTGQS